MKEMGYDGDTAGDASLATANEGVSAAVSWISSTGAKTEQATSASAAAVEAEDASLLAQRHEIVRELRREGEGVATVDVEPSYVLIGGGAEKAGLLLPSSSELAAADQHSRAAVMLSVASCVDLVRLGHPTPFFGVLAGCRSCVCVCVCVWCFASLRHETASETACVSPPLSFFSVRC
jgi:hypothetical protein